MHLAEELLPAHRMKEKVSGDSSFAGLAGAYGFGNGGPLGLGVGLRLDSVSGSIPAYEVLLLMPILQVKLSLRVSVT